MPKIMFIANMTNMTDKRECSLWLIIILHTEQIILQKNVEKVHDFSREMNPHQREVFYEYSQIKIRNELIS